MSLLGSIIRGVRGLFSRKAVIVPDNWVKATGAQLVKLGATNKSERYVKEGVKNPTLSISKRQYQQAQTGVRLETRAAQYKAGTRAKKTFQSRTKYPKRSVSSAGRKLEYENIPWSDLPKYFERMEKYGKVQFKALGETERKYEGNEGQWRTIRSNGGTEIKDFYDKINSETGFEGFSARNLPTKGAFVVWKNTRRH